jgi:hypothetical protein
MIHGWTMHMQVTTAGANTGDAPPQPAVCLCIHSWLACCVQPEVDSLGCPSTHSLLSCSGRPGVPAPSTAREDNGHEAAPTSAALQSKQDGSCSVRTSCAPGSAARCEDPTGRHPFEPCRCPVSVRPCPKTFVSGTCCCC